MSNLNVRSFAQRIQQLDDENAALRVELQTARLSESINVNERNGIIERMQAENERLKQQHANVLKNVSSEWKTQREANEVTCHSRMVGGVLCRWWGDGPVPSGVAVIDAQADLTAENARLRQKVVTLQNALRSIEKDAKQMREASHE